MANVDLNLAVADLADLALQRTAALIALGAILDSEKYQKLLCERIR
jgi:hypothetical protein